MRNQILFGKFFQKNNTGGQQGQILILALIFVAIIVAVAGTLIALVFAYFQQGGLAYAKDQAFELAEAGIEKALYEINQPGGLNYAGEADTALGSGSFSVSVQDLGNRKIIESTGHVPNSASPRAQKKVRLVLRTTSAGASFFYGVQVSYGGLTMGNNAAIIGSVYSNGNVTGAPNTHVTGDVWVAGAVAASPDQEQALQTGEQNVGNITAQEDAAQSFVADVTQTISRVSLLMRKVGNPSNATVRIVTDNAGSPSKNQIAAGALNATSVGTGFGWVDVSFTTNPQLQDGTKYWIVIDVVNPNASRYYVWAKHDNSGYGNGIGKHSDDWNASSPVWIDSNGDFGFQTWMGSGGNMILSIMDIGSDAHANTIQDSIIGADAYYQSISGSTVAGSSFPGSSDPPTLDLPISDSVIEDFKSAAEAGGTIVPVGGAYIIDSEIVDLGPVKIEGDLVVINNSILTLQGVVWVEGNIIFDNNVTIQLAADYAGDSGMIIADYPADPYAKGKVTVTNNANFFGSGDPESYIMVLSTFAHPTEAALDIRNNTDGVIFYSSRGITSVSNNVNLKEVIAYELHLSNNTSVQYESGLANVNFSSGPSGGWGIERGSWQLLE